MFRRLGFTKIAVSFGATKSLLKQLKNEGIPVYHGSKGLSKLSPRESMSAGFGMSGYSPEGKYIVIGKPMNNNIMELLRTSGHKHIPRSSLFHETGHYKDKSVKTLKEIPLFTPESIKRELKANVEGIKLLKSFNEPQASIIQFNKDMRRAATNQLDELKKRRS